MRVVITETAQESFEKSLELLSGKVGVEKLEEIAYNVISRAKSLGDYPQIGQVEHYLQHLSKEYRRIIEGHYKIIYRVEKEVIYVTDIFDTRQDPREMKG